jgi:diguanylate cyclase (GGDEF)-like protein/PAS domain S-box-containing protein
MKRHELISTRVLFLSLAPLLVTAVMLSAHFLYTRLQDEAAALRDRGEAIARQLAPACEYGVFAGNREILESLATAALRESDVQRVSVFDGEGRILAYAEREGAAASSTTLHRFQAPIHESVVRIDDFPGRQAGKEARRPIGRVELVLSAGPTEMRQREILFRGVLIAVILTVLTVLMAVVMVRGFVRPIERITDAVARIREGEQGVRVDAGAGGELGALERGINDMAETLEAVRNEERKLADDTLHLERIRAQVTLESIGDGVITTDANGMVSYLNPVAEQLTGWTLAGARGLSLNQVFQVVDERYGELRDYPLYPCIADGRALRHDSRHSLVKKDGRKLTIRDSASPIRDRDGNVIGAVVIFHDITEMQHMASRMAYLASHDPLTGLLNRHEFEQRMQGIMESARSEKRKHAICYLDLDQFKIVNDTCGHAAGDELLKQISQRLQKRIRTTDVLARLGGDEFGVILEDCPMDKAYQIADGLRQVVKDFRFAWQDRAFEVGVSIGLVTVAEDSGSLTDVLSAADSACYVAKDMGRNRVHIYQPDDDALARRHGEMQWVQRISEALTADWFEVHCQAIEPLDRQLAGNGRFYEILLRLNEPGKDLVPPTAFIPAGERYYLMPSIDRWVLRTTFRMLRDHQALTGRGGGEIGMVAINLSGQSLCDEAFLDYLLMQFRDFAIDPGHVCFEITETAAIANLSDAVRFIGRLKELGCKFALDDFGSGLSSFGYLKTLPVDYLKIAGNFVLGVANDPVDHAMVDAIIQIGHVMGLKTIAESVENDIVLGKLKYLGVDYAQGYGIGAVRPLIEVCTGSSQLRV